MDKDKLIVELRILASPEGLLATSNIQTDDVDELGLAIEAMMVELYAHVNNPTFKGTKEEEFRQFMKIVTDGALDMMARSVSIPPVSSKKLLN